MYLVSNIRGAQVCGVDGSTYPNGCEADCKGISYRRGHCWPVRPVVDLAACPPAVDGRKSCRETCATHPKVSLGGDFSPDNGRCVGVSYIEPLALNAFQAPRCHNIGNELHACVWCSLLLSCGHWTGVSSCVTLSCVTSSCVASSCVASAFESRCKRGLRSVYTRQDTNTAVCHQVCECSCKQNVKVCNRACTRANMVYGDETAPLAAIEAFGENWRYNSDCSVLSTSQVGDCGRMVPCYILTVYGLHRTWCHLGCECWLFTSLSIYCMDIGCRRFRCRVDVLEAAFAHPR